MPEHAHDIQVQVEAIGPCKKRLKVSVGAAGVRAEMEAQMQELAARVQLPGFRKGRAPRPLLEKRMGTQVAEEARDHLISEGYHEALKRENLHPIADPVVDKVDFDPAKGLAFEAVLEVRPEFELPSLAAIPLMRPRVQVTDADLDAGTMDLRRQRAEWVEAPAGAALRKGDLAVCDLALLDDKGEKTLWSQAGVAVVLDGRPLGELPTGPADALLGGATAGETCRMVATLPGDFSREDLRGKMATITVAVKEIRHEKLPEADDAMAQALGLKDLAELREQVRSHVQRHKEAEAHRKLEEELVGWLISKTPFELPQDVLKAHAEDSLKRATVDLLMRGIPERQLRENLEKLQSGTQAGSERRLRAMFILSRIAEQSKILVTESDVEDRVRRMAASYGERPEAILKRLEKEGGMASVRASIREAKVLDLLLSRAKVAEAS